MCSCIPRLNTRYRNGGRTTELEMQHIPARADKGVHSWFEEIFLVKSVVFKIRRPCTSLSFLAGLVPSSVKQKSHPTLSEEPGGASSFVSSHCHLSGLAK